MTASKLKWIMLYGNPEEIRTATEEAVVELDWLQRTLMDTYKSLIPIPGTEEVRRQIFKAIADSPDKDITVADLIDIAVKCGADFRKWGGPGPNKG